MGNVTTSFEGPVAIITYANAPWGTMTAAGAARMYHALKAASATAGTGCIILTGGVPGIFVRHYDVGELSQLSDQIVSAPAPRSAAEREPGFSEMIDLLNQIPQPVIAAINGLCMGGGFEMSLACDLRIAARSAPAIGLPETRIGIFPGGGGTQRLPRLIGEARAMEFILRGQTVDGATAASMGLVHEAVDDALSRSIEIANDLCARGFEGIAAAKRLIRVALDRPLAEGLADERRTFLEVLKSPSAQHALRAGGRQGVEIQRV
jgi:enoyl-CoA hydratase/carnithine racemase